MVALLDVNVLIALAWPNHVHHVAARRWFTAHPALGWATCPVTQSGFVRVSANPRAVDDARTPHDAILLLRRIVALPHHRFWADDTALATSTRIAAERLSGYRQVTDAHLLALALRYSGRLATFDGGVRALVPPGIDPQCAVCTIAPS